MSSCQSLAQRYAAETNNPIPPRSATTEIKSNWLLKQTWGCKLPNGTFLDNQQQCFEELGNQPNDQDYKPFINFLQEEGFLAWVNDRGLKCINRIVGRFYGFNEKTGTSNEPSPTVTPPDSQCWGACYNATENSEMCFECVKQVLQSTPSLCPQINVNDPQDDNLLKDSITCFDCISLSGGFVSIPNTSPVQPDNDAIIDNLWNCVTGSLPNTLNTTDIILIVLGSIFILSALIFVGVWYGVLRKKVLQDKAQDLALTQKIKPKNK